MAYPGPDALLPQVGAQVTSLIADPNHPPGRRPALICPVTGATSGACQPDRQRMSASHRPETSRSRGLVIISTCLAKIWRLEPFGALVWEGNFASKARHRGGRCGCRQPAAPRGVPVLRL